MGSHSYHPSSGPSQSRILQVLCSTLQVLRRGVVLPLCGYVCTSSSSAGLDICTWADHSSLGCWALISQTLDRIAHQSGRPRSAIRPYARSSQRPGTEESLTNRSEVELECVSSTKNVYTWLTCLDLIPKRSRVLR